MSASGCTRIAGSLATKIAGSDSPGQYAQAQGAGQAQPIGRVETPEGSVTILRADGTAIGLVFLDDSTFSLGDSARMVIDEQVYDPDAQTGKAAFSVVQGAFTFVSGQIAKLNTDAMTVQTPVMTIGIRGTAGAGIAGAAQSVL